MGTRAKGTMSARQINAAYPHQAEIEAPWNGLGSRLNIMIAWAGKHPSKQRSAGPDHLRFCFAEPTIAEAFQIEFGGQRVTVEPPPSKRAVW